MVPVMHVKYFKHFGQTQIYETPIFFGFDILRSSSASATYNHMASATLMHCLFCLVFPSIDKCTIELTANVVFT